MNDVSKPAIQNKTDTKRMIPMKKAWFVTLIGFMCIFVFYISSPQAGQVVTKELRSWAKNALEQEKTFQTIYKTNTLAVLYFQNKAEQLRFDPLRKGLCYMLITDLSKLKDIQLVERVKLQALVEELGLGITGLVDVKTAPRVGRLLGVQYLIGGDIDKSLSAELKIESELLKVKNEDILGRPNAEGILADLFQLEKKLLFDIIELLRIEITPEERVELEKPISTNINALMNFFKGITHSDQGNYKKAAGFYETALKQDPALGPVKDALQELQMLGLITEQKRSRNLLRSLRDRTSLTDQLTPEDTVKRLPDPGELEKRQSITIKW